ncbi:hypothetical protein AB0O64_19715 [Streptomyces sp. NPDC088341]|uniref:hypothetical protein n=1 Tax=Streptomyces sp. NPDC088341 TaxID=3154870 RepID=UPI0034155D1A
MTDPVSRTILLLDIEKYSDRDDVEQSYLRRMLYDIADRTLEAAGIDEPQRRRADRGDAVMELIDANASVARLLRSLLTEVPAQLRATNRMASSSAQIRLRAVLATGYVAIDGHGGWVGSDLNHACRLLDAELLREALRERSDDFVLCVSEPVHAGIVRHEYAGIPASDFHPVTVGSKNGPLPAWLHGPVPKGAATGSGAGGRGAEGGRPVPGGTGGRPAPASTEGGTGNTVAPEAAAPPAAPAPGPQFFGGSPSFGGSLVMGDQTGVSGGWVGGDVVMGGTTGPANGAGTSAGTVTSAGLSPDAGSSADRGGRS